MVGPPLSGKSTIAKKIVKADHNYVRVNRDDLRFMLRGKWTQEKTIEYLVNLVTEMIIKSSIKLGMSVIVDATHCKAKYIYAIKDLVPKDADVQIEYIVCDIPYWKQRLRNIWRNIKHRIWIPKHCSINMHKHFQHIKGLIDRGEI